MKPYERSSRDARNVRLHDPEERTFRMTRTITLVCVGLASVALVAGCGDDAPDTPRGIAENEARALGDNFDPYIPKNAVEQSNYNRSQQLYDDPTNILWCTVLNQSSTAPIVTFPVAGKLTSSTTSAFSPDKLVDHGDYQWSVVANPSVDGLYHTNPPPYRYGFTPGGNYVDVFNAPTFCTNKPLEFQRQSVEVTVDKGLSDATAAARDALAQDDPAQAQQILEEAAGE